MRNYIRSHHSTIHDELHELRRILNIRLLRAKHYTNKEYWSKMWVAMDVLEDTALGIYYYRKRRYPHESTGAKYLLLYGLLQLIFVQQDALVHLAKSLGVAIKLSDSPDISKLRNMRNRTIGHPTNKNENKKNMPNEYISINRNTLNKSHFSFTRYSENEPTIIHVSIKESINVQVDWLYDGIHLILEKLEKEWVIMSSLYKKKN